MLTLRSNDPTTQKQALHWQALPCGCRLAGLIAATQQKGEQHHRCGLAATIPVGRTRAKPISASLRACSTASQYQCDDNPQWRAGARLRRVQIATPREKVRTKRHADGKTNGDAASTSCCACSGLSQSMVKSRCRKRRSPVPASASGILATERLEQRRRQRGYKMKVMMTRPLSTFCRRRYSAVGDDLPRDSRTKANHLSATRTRRLKRREVVR